MTTIVADARVGSIGADTFCSYGYRSQKLFRVQRKGIFGCAGDDTAIARFEDWLLRKGIKPEIANTEDFAALQLLDNKIYIWGQSMRSELVMSPFDASPAQWFAVGSGSGYAIGCLAQGGTMQEALRIASTFDEATKEPFTQLSEAPCLKSKMS